MKYLYENQDFNMLSIRVRFSQLAVSRNDCKMFITNQLKTRDRLCVKVIDSLPESDQITYMPITILHKMQFITMEDISTPTTQRLIGRLSMHDEEMRYILTSANGDVILYIMSKETHCNQVKTRFVLPLSMDTRATYAICVPPSFSKAPMTIPNEVTWEFLHQLYSPAAKFPSL